MQPAESTSTPPVTRGTLSIQALLHGVATSLIVNIALRLPSSPYESEKYALGVMGGALLLNLVLSFWHARLTGSHALSRTIAISGAASIVGVAAFYSLLPAEGIASALYRAACVSPLMASLGAAIGEAAAYLIWPQESANRHWGVAPMIGLRYLRAIRGSHLSLVSYIAFVGVILGVSLLIVALSILSGFESDLVEKIVGANAHLIVHKRPGYAVDTTEMRVMLSQTPAIGAASGAPYVLAEVLIASDTNHTEAHFYGVNTAAALPIYAVLSKIIRGDLAHLERGPKGEVMTLPPPSQSPLKQREQWPIAPQKAEKPFEAVTEQGFFPIKEPQTANYAHLPGIAIGQEMAEQLHVTVGDSITLVSPLIEELTPEGPAPKSKAFRVAALFKANMFDIDAHYAYTTLPEAQRFLEMGSLISGVAYQFKNPDLAPKAKETMVKAMGGYPFEGTSWVDRNKNLFLSLKLEKAVAFLVLFFIVLVASFSIVNTLAMSVIDKTREIAILKTLGLGDSGVAKVFFIQGAAIGVIGTLVGTVMGTLLTLLIKYMGVYIDPDVYYVSALPIRLNAPDIVLICGLSCVLTLLAAVIPAQTGAKLRPVDGLRHE